MKPETPVAAWRAPKPDGIAHAFARRRSDRAYCGRPTWSERFDWPTRSRCRECERIVEAGR